MIGSAAESTIHVIGHSVNGWIGNGIDHIGRGGGGNVGTGWN